MPSVPMSLKSHGVAPDARLDPLDRGGAPGLAVGMALRGRSACYRAPAS